MSLHISTVSEVFCKSPVLKCGHQMIHKAASEICVWWRTKSKLKAPSVGLARAGFTDSLQHRTIPSKLLSVCNQLILENLQTKVL